MPKVQKDRGKANVPTASEKGKVHTGKISPRKLHLHPDSWVSKALGSFRVNMELRLSAKMSNICNGQGCISAKTDINLSLGGAIRYLIGHYNIEEGFSILTVFDVCTKSDPWLFFFPRQLFFLKQVVAFLLLAILFRANL